VHQIIRRVLVQAVSDGLLAKNPCDSATPPTAAEAKSDEQHPWTEDELAAFLGWAQDNASNYTLWKLLANTGMRRGEALALRWRDFNQVGREITIRGSAGIVRVHGEGAQMEEGTTKTGTVRKVGIGPETIDALRSWWQERQALAPALASPDALIFGDLEDELRNAEHVSRQFKRDIARCQKALGKDVLPEIRLHDLRHTHATILLENRVPVHVVSKRLGHASAVVTMTVYAHVLPGSDHEAADDFERLIGAGKVA